MDINWLDDADMHALFPFIQQISPDLTKAQFDVLLPVMQRKGYRAAAVWDDGKICAVAGIWPAVQFWCGEHWELDNVVVDAQKRGQGYGRALMQWVEQRAEAAGMQALFLKVYQSNVTARSLYKATGFDELGVACIKPLNEQKQGWDKKIAERQKVLEAS